ncbi:translation initiation factor IF-2 N-terminal domain-containing protein, partial [Nocardia cyriacigeorgica]|uniref:translation initiation factor IF-2 N-terminal domain-containing protein n=1 Tax=Nocardia cyriacigeorgica TaxID=135487 RepID=UPI002454FE0D
MADQEPLDTTSQDADQLPERIRVHALAKRLGVTSKRILAKLGELGSDARSPQSNVERAVAESVRDALATPEAEPGAAGVYLPRPLIRALPGPAGCGRVCPPQQPVRYRRPVHRAAQPAGPS